VCVGGTDEEQTETPATAAFGRRHVEAIHNGRKMGICEKHQLTIEVRE